MNIMYTDEDLVQKFRTISNVYIFTEQTHVHDMQPGENNCYRVEWKEYFQVILINAKSYILQLMSYLFSLHAFATLTTTVTSSALTETTDIICSSLMYN